MSPDRTAFRGQVVLPLEARPVAAPLRAHSTDVGIVDGDQRPPWRIAGASDYLHCRSSAANGRLRVISKAAINEFSKRHKDALESLLHWHGIARRAAWKHLADLRADFPHADAVDAFTVFNISGNKYRRVSVIKYRWQIVYIRNILRYADYDRGRWKR